MQDIMVLSHLMTGISTMRHIEPLVIRKGMDKTLAYLQAYRMSFRQFRDIPIDRWLIKLYRLGLRCTQP